MAIGSTNADKKLVINGGGDSLGFQSAGTTKWHLGYLTNGLNFAETGQADGRLFLKDGGAVGVGTTSPGGKLGVESCDNSEPVLELKGTGTADLVNVLDNTTEVFTILDGGNVGVGIANPGEKLEVNGDIKFGTQGIKISTGTSSPNGIVAGNPGDLYIVKNGASSSFWINTSTDSPWLTWSQL